MSFIKKSANTDIAAARRTLFTPLALSAAKNDNVELLEKLKEAVRLSIDSINQISINLIVRLLIRLIDLIESSDNSQGCNLAECDYDGRSTLHVAAHDGCVKAVEYLLHKGTSVHVVLAIRSDDSIRFD